jgi:hypothetical protein
MYVPRNFLQDLRWGIAGERAMNFGGRGRAEGDLNAKARGRREAIKQRYQTSLLDQTTNK